MTSARVPFELRKPISSPTALRLGIVLILALNALVGCKNLPNLKEAETEVDIAVDVLNKYVWRGMLVSDVIVAQPAINVANSGFTANVWGNVDLEEQDDVDNKYQCNEVDVSLSYEHTVECVSLSGGFIHYMFPNSGLPVAGSSKKEGDTTELWAAAGLPGIPLSPALTGYMDVDEANGGSYLSLSVSHSFELDFLDIPSFSTVDLSAAVGWGSSEYNRYYFPDMPRNPGAALTDYSVGLAIPIDLGAEGDSGWTVTPMVTFTSLIDSDIKHAHDGDDWNVVFGVGLGLSF